MMLSKMITGILNIVELKEITAKRFDLLEKKKVLPLPKTLIHNIRSTDLEKFLKGPAVESLKENGLLIIQLDKLLSSDTLLNVCSELGTPIAENPTDEVLVPYIEKEVILNVISNNTNGNSASQPFTKRHLNLHTECSRRKVVDQPRYLAFMCCDEGELSSAQTVLVPMKEVFDKLSEKDKKILKNVRYSSDLQTPPFLRTDRENRNIFSIRDFYPDPMYWSFDDENHAYTAADIHESIKILLSHMYSVENTSGITWKNGMLVIVDNTIFFHGKSASDQIDIEKTRHLKRLRIK
ncbi:MAG: hypothetical protein GQ574_04185 [Crocinitomix sp.]|nr:hypothetical protein [Crocinitomix sp.]